MSTNAAALSANAWTEKLSQLGSEPFLHDALPRAFLGLLVYAILLVLLRLGNRRPFPGRLAPALRLLGLACVLHLFLGEPLGRLFPAAPRVFTAAVVFFLLALLLRAGEIVLFEVVFPKQGRKAAPVVLRDIARAVLTALLLALIVKGFFPAINFNVLAVSSLVVGYVLASATQDTLGSLVAGLALNAENSFSIGDWIAVGDRVGRVTDITWRSTRLRTKNLEDIIVPNATLSKETLVNFSRPTPELRTRIQIGAGYDSPPNLVRQVLLEAIRDIPGIDPVPPPKVRVVNYADFAIEYEALFFIHEYERLEEIKADLMNLVWYRFKRAAIPIPYPIRDVRARQVTREDDRAAERERVEAGARLLAAIDLFAKLTDAERLALAGRCRPGIFGAGETIVRQGEAGHSLFLIESGRVGIFVDQNGRDRTRVGELGPGAFFGERSLLTGEGRSATVSALADTAVLELDKDSFKAILQARPEMAEYLATVLETRGRERAEKSAGAGPSARPITEQQKSHLVMARILHFFGLSPNNPQEKH